MWRVGHLLWLRYIKWAGFNHAGQSRMDITLVPRQVFTRRWEIIWSMTYSNYTIIMSFKHSYAIKTSPWWSNLIRASRYRKRNRVTFTRLYSPSRYENFVWEDMSHIRLELTPCMCTVLQRGNNGQMCNSLSTSGFLPGHHLDRISVAACHILWHSLSTFRNSHRHRQVSSR